MDDKKPLTAKEDAAIEFYCNPASETFNNWCQSYRKAAYAQCTGWKTNAIKVLHKNYIQAAIQAYRDKNRVEVEHNREISLRKLQRAYDIALEQKNPSGMVAAVREADDISGLRAQQPIEIKQEIHHSTAQTETDLLQKRLRLLSRMRSQPTGIERN